MSSEKRNLFLDYGELICRYNFNSETLQRAHDLTFKYLTSQGKKISPRGLENAHKKAIQAYLQARSKDNSEWTMNQIMGLMLSNLGINADVQHIGEIYKLNDHDSTPFPNSRRILIDLSNRYQLGIISNLPHDSLLSELEREGMLSLFDPIVISYQVGFRKPNPEIYQKALKRAKTTAKKSIFISHDKPEVVGAENIGMKGILVKSLEEVIGTL